MAPSSQASARNPGDIANAASLPVTVTVNVREASGMLLESRAFVKLSSQGRRYSQTLATQENSSATFNDVIAGDYEVEVSSAGYRTVTEPVNIARAGSYPVFIYLHSESEDAAGTARPPASMTMTPKLQSELDKGMEKMRKQQYEAARQHIEKAAKIAPGNADVQYLLGVIESAEKHLELARTRFESALTLYPGHERSLLALGELQLQTGDGSGAVRTLEKAFAANGADWKTHFLLAQAYNSEKDYTKAELHASRAAELGKDKGALPLLLLGRIYAAEDRRDTAKQAFALLIKEFPDDPAAQQAKSEIAALAARPSTDQTTTATAAASPASLPTASSITGAPSAAIGLADSLPLLVTEHAWAPADVDGKEYTVAPGISCGQGEVLERAQKRMLNQLQNFDKFMATEHIEHQQVDAHGNEGDLRFKNFSYLVFLHPFKNDSFSLEESRDGGQGVDAFPTNLATTGLVGLGVAILEPEYEGDFEYKCEGLSSWRGQAAWQVRFEQKRNVESRVRVWRRRGETFPVALKGRIWLAANSYDLLHLETDLRDPIAKLMLVRDHLVIDYGPVTFERGNEKLWLPWRAEMFMELHGKRYHHRHTLTDYLLFSVDTTNQIGRPKETPAPPETEQRP
jgi:Tfp pilus assembly protein PilF